MNLNLRDKMFPILSRRDTELEKERLAIIKATYDKLSDDQTFELLVIRYICLIIITLIVAVTFHNIYNNYLGKDTAKMVAKKLELQTAKMDSILTISKKITNTIYLANAHSLITERKDYVSLP